MNAAINDWYCFSCVSNQAMRLVKVLYTNTKQARFLECVNVASRIPLAISVMLWKKDRDAFLSCELSNIIMFYISQYLIYSKFWKTSCTYMYIVTFLVSNWRPSWIFFVSFSLFLLRYFSYKFCASDFSETTWSFLMKFLHYFSKRLGLLELILCTNIRIPFMYYSTSYILLSKQGIHPPFPKSAALASSLEKEPQRFSYSLIIV